MADEAGADAVGLVFYRKSPRYVDPDVARRITCRLSPFCTPVALFVDESAETVVHTARVAGCRVVQLHGREPESVIRDIVDSGLAVIKARPIADSKDVDALLEADDSLGDVVSAWLVDTASAEVPGGSGRRFNWELLTDVHLDRPLILAGGLTPQNVGRAIVRLAPYAVDVSTGVERSPGVKSTDAVHKFIRSARSAGHSEPSS